MGRKTICSMIFQKCIGSDMFLQIRHCLAEVCALPKALLVLSRFKSSFLFNHTLLSNHFSDSVTSHLTLLLVFSAISNVVFGHVVQIITSATEVGRTLCFLLLYVCLIVCLCARYLKKWWTDSDETWRTGWVCGKDELIRFR